MEREGGQELSGIKQDFIGKARACHIFFMERLSIEHV